VPDDPGARIAAQAQSRVGQRFCLHGRTAESGFDCVGLLADALHAIGCDLAVPGDYTIRGRFEGEAFHFFAAPCFVAVAADDVAVSGDFGVVRIAARQLHFIIFGAGGFIHAHAGLRRVVMTPLPVPWPIIGRWRFIGD
jgi:murein DD-endopeptidase / murein LD-carboxypeptidase